MSIHFICPHCAAATDVDEKLAGQTGPCSHCGKSITFPIVGRLRPAPSRHGAGTMVKVGAVIVAGLAVLAAGIFAALTWLTPSEGRDDARRMRCMDNLERIAKAIKQYEAVNGYFPPAHTVDKHGRPMHSWRVLLLPYLELQDLADRYRFDEPWDSPVNRAVTDLTLEVFQCPSQPDAKGPTTNYMMVVGPHTISNGQDSKKIIDITDGLANTIMLVEVADSTVHWAQPVDVRFENLDFDINGGKGQGISSHHPPGHPQGANVAFCDFSVRWLKNSTKPFLVKAMLTIGGGEPPPGP